MEACEGRGATHRREPDRRPGSSDLSLESRRILVEIPTGFAEMQVRDSPLALDWRMSTREIFKSYFARGYRAVDFFLAREARKGQYLLSLVSPSA